MAVKLFGVDVSEHQGKINWKTVAKHVDFAIIRLGYGMDLQSQDDSYFEDNVRGCEKYHIPYGVYIYSYAKYKNDVDSEIAHTLRCLGYCKEKPQYGVWYDMEDPSVQGGDLDGVATKFCQAIERKGYDCGIYAGSRWLEESIDSSENKQYDRWVAQYYSICEYIGKITMWQYSSSGKVPGISGRVDVNYCYTDKFAKKSDDKDENKGEGTPVDMQVRIDQPVKNVREQPTTKSEIINKLNGGCTYAVSMISNSGNWYKLKYRDGWFSKAATTEFKPYMAQVIAKDGLNVRAKYSTSSDIVSVLGYKERVKIYGLHKSWGKTADGWVFLKYVKKV